MRDATSTASDMSVESVITAEAARIRANEIIDFMQKLGDNDEAFPFAKYEDLGICHRTISVLMSLEQKNALHKRSHLIKSLKECKSRVMAVLEACDDEGEIPWGPDDNPEKMLKETGHNYLLPFMMDTEARRLEVERRNEQSQYIKSLDDYIRSYKEKLVDTDSIIKWFTKFSSGVSWQDLRMTPVKKRKMEMEESYSIVSLAVERFDECMLKLQELLKLLVADEDCEFLFGKMPPAHIVEENRKKGIVAKHMRCSYELRMKFEKYERLTHGPEDSETELKTVPAEQQKADKVASDVVKRVTIISSGIEQDSWKNKRKHLESELFREVNKFWKEVAEDIAGFMQQVKSHRFTKPSCRLKLGRAILMLGFLRSFVQDRVSDAEVKGRQLEENKRNIARLHDEINLLNQKLVAEKKMTLSTQRKMGKLKQQLDTEVKNNEALRTEVEIMEKKATDDASSPPPEHQKPTSPPVNERSQDVNQKMKLLEAELARSENRVAEIRAEAEELRKKCDDLNELLAKANEQNSALTESLTFAKKESRSSLTRLSDMKKKMLEQEENLQSMRVVMSQKDKIIRTMKQAAIELQSNEGERRWTPSQPPPSPEEESPKRPESSTKSFDKEENTEAGESTFRQRLLSQTISDTSPESDSARDTPPPPKPELKLEKPRPVENLYEGRKKGSIRKSFFIPKRPSVDKKPKPAKVDQAAEDLKDLKKEHKKKIEELMKAEDDVNNLCFSVKDETLRLQRGMKQFSDDLDYELKKMPGSKGLKSDVLVPKLGNWSAGGLLSNFNDMLDDSMNLASSLGGDSNMREMDPMERKLSQRRKTGLDMLQKRESMQRQRYGSHAGVGPNIYDPGLPSEEGDEHVIISRVSIVPRKRGSKDKRTSNEFGLKSEDKLRSAESVISDTNFLNVLGPSARTPPSTGKQTRDGLPASMTSGNGPRSSRLSQNTSVEHSVDVSNNEEMPKKEEHQKRPHSDQERNGVVSKTPNSKYGSSVKVFHNDRNARKMMMERKRARLGERGSSAVIPYRSPTISIETKGDSIFEPPSPQESGSDNHTSVKKKVRLRIMEKAKRRDYQVPVKQAEQYVRVMSKQFGDFLQDMNVKLVNILRNSRQEMEDKVHRLEDQIFRSDVKHSAQLAIIKSEKNTMERELKRCKQNASNSKQDSKEILPQDLIDKLKVAENELDEAKKRLDKAAQKHEGHADQYRNVAKSLENQLKLKETENAQLKRKTQMEKWKTNELQVQLSNTLKSQRVLFLSHQDHIQNFNQLKTSEGVDSAIKKVALSLLRRSMLHPEESLRLLIQHYCQHVKYTICQERVRKCIVEKEILSSKNLMKGRCAVDKDTILANLLAGLEVRKELARQRNAKKRKTLDSDRQKIFVKMALVMQKLSSDKKDLYLVPPMVQHVYKKPCGHSHHNTPVPTELSERQFCIAENQYAVLPDIGGNASLVPGYSEPSGENLSMKGTRLLTDLQNLKAAVPHWFPGNSLSCPFSISGNMKSIESSGHFPRHRVRINAPLIMHLEVQSGLREARKTVIRRLCTGKRPENASPMIASIKKNSSHATFINQRQSKITSQHQLLNAKNAKSFNSEDLYQSERDTSGSTSLHSIYSPLTPVSTPTSFINDYRRSTPSDSITVYGSALDFTESNASDPPRTSSPTTRP